MISSRRYNSAWDDSPTHFRHLDSSAMGDDWRRADNIWESCRGLEVVGPLVWFVLRVGPKDDQRWPARAFILSDLQEILEFRVPKEVELRSLDLVAGPRFELGCMTGMCIVRVWRPKKIHADGLIHLLETADGELVPLPYADTSGMDVTEFEAVLSLPAPMVFEEDRDGLVR